MAFQVSPGVQVKEIDLTNVVPAVSTSIGAIAGAFQWGPVEEVRTIGSEKELVEVFGKPNSDTFNYFMNAAAFLQYGNSLRVVRAATANFNATNDSTASVNVSNADDFNATVFPGTVIVAAKYPGALGNSLKVSICPANSTAFSNWAYKSQFDSAPGTSTYVSNKGGSNDEVHLVVIDEDGSWSGEEGTVLETFAYLSQASDAKSDDGSNNYYHEVINNQSKYAWMTGHPTTFTDGGEAAAGNSFTAPSAAEDYSLAGGVDDNAPTIGELKTAYDIFADAETIDVNLIIGCSAANGADAVTHANNLIAIAEGRKDVVAFVSPAIADTVNATTPSTDVIDWADQLTSSSYAVMDSGALYVYDKYNDVYRWITASGHMAGLCANADNVADAWFSPAGLNRGQLLGVTKVAFNPKKADRDDLYKSRVNPIVSFPGEGTVLFGDKTALAKPSAFDRINVRRLFIVLEKAIATASKFQLFEFNDEFTRAQFRNLVEPFLRDIKGRRGITDFLVVCDETNNTGEVIDTNRFVADIYIKPARSINFISLNFIATRTGVEFSEIVGQ